MDVKIFDLSREYKTLGPELVAIFERVASSGEFILGGEVAGFEQAFASYIGVQYGLGVASGTDAIKVAGLACGLRAGDQVITTPNTYIATVMALSPYGITPVLCDIDPETYTMDPGKLEDALSINGRVRLCIPVHLYGHPCDMDEIAAVCDRYGVSILEDACQAHGARYKSRKTGSFGKTAAFSFYPTKNLGCYGDGGAVVTDDEETFERAHAIRVYGQKDRHVHLFEGLNSRLDEIQAAFLSLKLQKLDEWNGERRRIAAIYRRELDETSLVLPVEKSWAYHVYHLYVVRTKEREKLMDYLKQKGVITLVHYPTPVHLQQAYAYLGLGRGYFPEAERAAEEVLSLPMYPGLTEEEVFYTCRCIKDFFAG